MFQPGMMHQGMGTMGSFPQPAMGAAVPMQQMHPRMMAAAPQQPLPKFQQQHLPAPVSMGGPAGHGIEANVIQIAGCLDTQECQDIDISGLPLTSGASKAGGACTHAMHAALDGKGAGYTYRNLLVDMGQILRKGQYTQVPQLSTSHPCELDAPVVIRPAAATRIKSLLIGINYKGQGRGELQGCHNDVKKVQQRIASLGFSSDPSSQLVLMDDGAATPPTKANIWAAFEWLTKDAQPGDAFYVHFSGHGGQVKDMDGDGFDQTMIPVDHKTAGTILDDDILDYVIKPLPKGVNMFSVMDCCHSGSIMDLPYVLTVDATTGAALSAGEVKQLGQNQVFLNKGLRRSGPGGKLASTAGDFLTKMGQKASQAEGTKLGGLAILGGCGLCIADCFDLLGDSDQQGGNSMPGAGTGAVMCAAGLCSCCMDVTDFMGDSKPAEDQRALPPAERGLPAAAPAQRGLPAAAPAQQPQRPGQMPGQWPGGPQMQQPGMPAGRY
mmetsp:Transcript_35669/g.69881  ORF Transcript_35669/g.69881 Transcript_35669/m.69881 type:complete len:495 (-) Transcript_35669:254-1738(-)